MTHPWDERYIYLHLPSTKSTLVFQSPAVIPCEDRCLEPLKAEPQEVFQRIQTPILTRYDWKTRATTNVGKYTSPMDPSWVREDHYMAPCFLHVGAPHRPIRSRFQWLWTWFP